MDRWVWLTLVLATTTGCSRAVVVRWPEPLWCLEPAASHAEGGTDVPGILYRLCEARGNGLLTDAQYRQLLTQVLGSAPLDAIDVAPPPARPAAVAAPAPAPPPDASSPWGAVP